MFDGGREIGTVADVAFGAGEAPLLVVESKDRAAKLPFEIPFAVAYLEKLDLAGKQVRMKLPDGMLEVNGPLARKRKKSVVTVRGSSLAVVVRKGRVSI